MVLEDYYNSKESKIGDEDINGDDNENTNKSKRESTPSKSVTPTTSQRINTLKLNINALKTVTLKLPLRISKSTMKIMVRAHSTLDPLFPIS